MDKLAYFEVKWLLVNDPSKRLLLYSICIIQELTDILHGKVSNTLLQTSHPVLNIEATHDSANILSVDYI